MQIRVEEGCWVLALIIALPMYGPIVGAEEKTTSGSVVREDGVRSNTAHFVDGEPTPKTTIAENRGYLGYQTRYEEGPDDLGRIRILDVHPGGVADKAQLRRGDLIVSFDGRSFRFENDLDMVRQLSWIEDGTEVRLELLRGNRVFEKTLVAERLPEAMRARLEAWVSAAEDWYERGGSESCRAKKAAADPA